MHEIVGKDETLDILCSEKLKIVQKKNGYRFSIDAFLLAAFIKLKKHERLLDIGSGCGIIPIYIAKKGFANDMTGVEIQKELFDTSQKNRVINGCKDQVHFVNADIRSFVKDMKGTHFHVVVSNPPYTKKLSGRTPPRHSRFLARYEETLDIESLTSAASSMLMKKGRFYVIYPARRVGELICESRSRSLALKRLRLVHPARDKKANLVLAEFAKDGGIGATIEKPLYIFEAGANSEEVRSYYSFED